MLVFFAVSTRGTHCMDCSFLWSQIHDSFNIKIPNVSLALTANSMYQRVTMLSRRRTGKRETAASVGALTVSKITFLPFGLLKN